MKEPKKEGSEKTTPVMYYLKCLTLVRHFKVLSEVLVINNDRDTEKNKQMGGRKWGNLLTLRKTKNLYKESPKIFQLLEMWVKFKQNKTRKKNTN